MRRVLFASTWIRSLTAWLVAVGLLASGLTPMPAAATTLDALLRSAICSAGPKVPAGSDTPAPHAHAHCVLCQTLPVLFTPPDATSLPLPARWASAQPAVSESWTLSPATPRLYASRAPPSIG